MSTTALLRDKLAPATGRVLLRLAFGADVATVGGAGLDWLSVRLGETSEAERWERFARFVANRILVELAPLFTGSNPEAVALALGETLDEHLDARFLARHDLSADRAITVARSLPKLRDKTYADPDIRLYERVMPELIRRLVREFKRIPDFDVAFAVETLERLRRLERTRTAWEQRRTEGWHAFERDYADAVLDRWNKLELFGIDVTEEVQRRQELSVAYIPLNLQSGQGGNPGDGLGARNGPQGDADNKNDGVVSFEELLAGTAEAGQPLIILGEAGSGKTTLLRWAACHAIRRAIEPGRASPFEGRRRRRPGGPVPGEGIAEGWAADEVRSARRSPNPRTPTQPARAGPRPSPGTSGIQPDANSGSAARSEAEQHLVWWARVPFLSRLREVKDGALPKELDWPGRTAALPRDPPAGWIDEILGAGHGLVLIDGLDELGSGGRDIARDTLRTILRDSRGNLVVLTSRPGAFDPGKPIRMIPMIRAETATAGRGGSGSSCGTRRLANLD